jgi:predicted TIM-barrel fold metal-dependent hydrolase
MNSSPRIEAIPVIDACVHHHWATDQEIVDRMDPGWREYMMQSASLPVGGGPMLFVPANPYQPPGGLKLSTSYPDGGRAGSSLELIRRDVLDAAPVERAVLAHDTAMYTPVNSNPFLADEAARAINDWTIERWLDGGDERLHALAIVPNQLPDRAAAEIRRVGGHPRIAGLLLGASGLSRPFGHPVYRPIFEAAAELDLPLVVRAGLDAPLETLSSHTGGGQPATFTEYYVLSAQSLMSAVASVISQGIFEEFPSMRMLIVGAGSTWIPALMWRFDNEFIPSRRETPWVTRRPTEYMREHILVSTYPLERVDDEAWRRLVGSFEGMEDILCYASGYPSWDADGVDEVAQRLPADWHQRVFHDNAARLFGWEAGVAAAATGARS